MSTGAGRAFLAGILVRHAALAARLAVAAPRAPRLPPAPGAPVRAALLATAPAGHYGTVFRLSRWAPWLAERGVAAEVLCPVSDVAFEDPRAGLLEPLRRRPAQIAAAADADVVFLHRGLFPFSPWQRPTFERLLARRNPRIVYDFYDSIWVGRRQAHAAARGRLARWLNPADLIESLVRLSAAVTVSNDFLAGFARPLHRDVRILPMVVEPSDYDAPPRPAGGPLTLGWMGGAGNVPQILALAPVLREAARRIPLRLRVVAPVPVAIPGVAVESLTHPWSPAAERADLAAVDVGLLPLTEDETSRGKSPLKLLQFAGAGRPVVASPVASGTESFADGESILFARDDAGWIAALAALAADPARRREIGARARDVVRRRHSYAAHADAFAGLLREVASGQRNATRRT